MRTIVETIKSIDENSKKIVFKHFDQQNVNILAKEAPDLIKKITKIGKDAMKMDKYQGFNSDDLESDSSGNQSDNDEINMIQKFKKKMTHKDKVETDDSFDENQSMDLSEDEPDDQENEEDGNIFNQDQPEPNSRRNQTEISDTLKMPKQ